LVLVRAVVMKLGSLAPVAVAAVVMAMVLDAASVGALELVPGGYGAGGPEAAGAPAPLDDERLAFGDGDGAAGLALDFTPRHGTGLWQGEAGATGADPGLRFDLTIRETPGAMLDQLGFGTGRGDFGNGADPSGQAGLTVGGAMRWSDWSIGGSLGRAQILGTDVDLMAASFGYGRITAEIGYGQSDGAATAATTAAPRDVLMLSTDLAAWSWLTLESDFALGSNPAADQDRGQDHEPVAVGRFGLRLNF
jgi:hypothetical protein